MIILNRDGTLTMDTCSKGVTKQTKETIQVQIAGDLPCLTFWSNRSIFPAEQAYYTIA